MTILFKTKLRKNLLTYSFTHPDERFYVRELAAIINEDAGNLSRELKKLENEGLFDSCSKGNLKFYYLNKSYPLFKELKQIVFKTEGVEGSLRNLVHKYETISFAFIYGSYARNKEKKTSDVDLAIVGEFPRNEFTRQIKEMESRLNREINFTSYSKEEFYKEKKKKGSFLNLVLIDKIIILKGKVAIG